MRLRAAFVLALAAAPLCAADLHVGPGAPFQEIQAAIDAAAPGDVIHVAPGTYDVFVLEKPLALLGAGSGQVLVRDPDGPLGSVIRSIPAGTEAVVSGLALGGPQPGFPPLEAPALLTVEACAGRVALHDLAAEMTAPSAYARHIVTIEDAQQVVVARCRLIGTAALAGAQIPLSVTSARVWITGSELRGGDGHLSSPSPHGLAFGAPALHLQIDTQAYVSRSILVGGRGGATPFLSHHVPQRGGPGIYLQTSAAVVAGGPDHVIRGGDAAPPAPPGSFYAVPPQGGHAIAVDEGEILFGMPPISTAGVGSDVLLQGGTSLDGTPAPAVFGLVVDVSPAAHPTVHPTATQHPPGTSSALELSGPPNAVQLVGFALASADAAALPFGELLLPLSAKTLLTTVLNGIGLASASVAVPPNPALAGTRVWLQSLSIGSELALSAPALFVVGP